MGRNSARKHVHEAAGESAPEAENPGVDLSVLKATAGFMIRIVQLQIFQAFYDQFKERGISTGVYTALVAIAANPGIKQGVLGTAMLVKRPNMTKLVNHLVARNFVERRISLDDKRAMDLYLTAAGRAALADIAEDAVLHDREATAALSADERRVFMCLLGKLSDDLSRRRRVLSSGISDRS